MTFPEEGIRLDLPFVELALNNRRINVSCKEAYLTLHEKHLRYKIICNYSSSSNDEEILKDYKCNNNRVWMRSDISLVEMFKDNTYDTWAVGIKFSFGDGPEWDFNDLTKAKEAFNKLTEYFITR